MEQALSVVRSLPPFVEPVGLFVDEPLDRVREVVRALGLRTVQLHGRESVDYVRQLAPLRVIKAMALVPDQPASGLDAWAKTHPPLAGILWDAPPSPRHPNAGSEHNSGHVGQTLPPAGGEGLAWDWSAVLKTNGLEHLTSTLPFIFAGGLTPDNVAQVVTAVRPYGVDVSSGVESSRGVKDIEKIRVFCQAVRSADRC